MVSAVTGTSTTETPTIASADAAVADVDFNTYLKLLVTQLANQDPLDPMDPNEMTAQIATYSQIEQQIKSNSYLEQMAQQDSYNERTLAIGYIGKEVLVPGTTLAFQENTAVVDFAYELAESAYATQIEIRDEDGLLVKKLDGQKTAGLHYITWDGTNEDGELLPVGNYKFSVSGANVDGESVDMVPYVYVGVVAVEADENDITLMLSDNTKTNFDDARTVRGWEEPVSEDSGTEE